LRAVVGVFVLEDAVFFLHSRRNIAYGEANRRSNAEPVNEFETPGGQRLLSNILG